MVRPIDEVQLTQAVWRFCSQSVFLHMEVTPGGFIRNLQAELEEVVVRRDGSTYRVALRCRGNGWVVLEGLTHMAIGGHSPRTERVEPRRGVPPEADRAPLLLCTLEGEDRMTRAIQISKEAFAA